MANFHFELVSPDKLVFSGEAQSVLVPGSEGDFVVLKDHAPVMASLRPGVVDPRGRQGKHTRDFRARRLRRRQPGRPDPAGRDRDAGRGAQRRAHLDQEIKNAEEDLADATDEQKRLAQEKLDRLRELKDALKL